MFRLPISEILVEVRPFTGGEEMLLLESGGGEVGTSIELARRLVRHAEDGTLDPAALPVPDLEALLLHVRRMLLGDEIVSHSKCQVSDCGLETDISFSIDQYLANHRSRMPGYVHPVKEEAGWFALRGSEATFRLVTADDLLATKDSRHPERELARRTIRPDNLSARDIRRVQRAMESMAPPLAREVEGRCPACGTAARFFFNPQSYIQRELRYEAAFLYEDVHLLAQRYHWPEEKILSLPHARRVQYAELAMREGVAH